jgi:hypothetical protein
VNEHTLPRTKLWAVEGGFIIVLECDCGRAVDYPGHPEERDPVLCPGCGIEWTVRG